MTTRVRLTALAAAGLVVALVTVARAAPAEAAAFVVTTTADSGAGSLDQAIIDANANAGPDTITFAPATNGINIVDNALTSITSDITITGNGVGVTIIQSTSSLIIDAQLGATVVASISALTFTGTGQLFVNSGSAASSATGTLTSIALEGGKDVNVNAGDGTTNATFTNLTMGAGSAININSGDGNATATMSNVTMVDGDVNINAGNGNTNATFTGITVPDGVNINSGNGTATGTFTNATISDSAGTAVNVNSGNGTANGSFTNATVTATLGTAVNANTGEGTTTVNLTEVQATSPSGTVMNINAGLQDGTRVTVARSSFINSEGGIEVNRSVLNMTNSTVSNVSSEGDMIDARASTVNLTNVTMMNSGDDGLVVSNGTTATLKNTIIANVDDGNCAVGEAAIVSTGGNISDDASCTAFTQTGDDQNVNPLLGPLAANGGPTLTHLPQAGSPAIDGGVADGCPATDQRLVPRPQDGNDDTVVACDSGSVEIGGQLADVSLTKSADVAETGLDGTVVWTLLVNNIGGIPVTNVVVNDTLPLELALVSVTAPAGWDCSSSTQGSPPMASCKKPSMGPGESASILVTTKVKTLVDADIFNSAYVGTSTPESSTANNTGQARVPAGELPATGANTDLLLLTGLALLAVGVLAGLLGRRRTAIG